MTIQEALSVTVNFGKHKGKDLAQIAGEEVTYIGWLAGRDDIKTPKLADASKVLAEYLGPEIQAIRSTR